MTGRRHAGSRRRATVLLATALLLALAAVGAAVAAPLRAQAARTPDAREPDAREPDAALTRLDAATRAAVVALADSAHAAGLPVAPLHAKASEGASKGAPGPRIVAAVRELSLAMLRARAALGGVAAEGELVAGAGALAVGVPADDLRRLRGALGARAATQSLVVLTDLVRRGVARTDAVAAVVQLARAGTADAQLLQLRAEVARDVEAGVAPRTAMETRLRQYGGVRTPRAPLLPPPAGPPTGPPVDPSAGPSGALSSYDAPDAPQLTAHAEMGWRQWAHDGANASSPVTGAGVAAEWRLLRVQARGALPAARPHRDRVEGELLAALRLPMPTALHAAGVRAELRAGAARSPFDATAARAQRGADARVWLERGWGGAWASAGRAESWHDGATPSVSETALGAWTALGGVTVTASMHHRSGTRVDVFGAPGGPIDTLDAGTPNPDCRSSLSASRAVSATCRSRLATTDVDVGARWARYGVELHGAVGARIGSRSPGVIALPGLLPATLQPARARDRAWASGGAVVSLTSNLSVLASAARLPSDVVRGLPARRTFALGLRFAPTAPLGARGASRPRERDGEHAVAERVVVAGARVDGRRPVHLVVPGAASVELRGDMTDWEPVSLTSRDGRTWRLGQPLAAGVYHFAVRVDGGEWRPLADAPSAEDGFGGTVGVLVVP